MCVGEQKMRAASNHIALVRAHEAADQGESHCGTVLVYAAELLPYSQTFIRDHVASLRRNAILVGAKSVPGLSTDGLNTALLPNSRWSRILLWTAGISPALDRIVEANDVSLIHAHFADAGARLAKYARRRGLPLVVTLHGADVLRRRRLVPSDLITWLLWPRLMRTADMFLPVSDHLARKAVERGVPPAKLRRHYLGIPVFPLKRPKLKNGTPPVILFIGRLVEKKGLTYLIEACKILARRTNEFRLKVIGDGPLLDQCQAQARSLDARVIFAGALSPQRVREELAEAQIACMPSVEARDGDNEGLPIVSLEAQAAGVPIVAFDQGPVPECVRSNFNGLLAKDRSAEDLASCLEKLLRSPELRRSIGDQARRYVDEHFNIDRQSNELDAIYDQVLARYSNPAEKGPKRGVGQS
jgi:glycosyltransferase involved in cell wall biosynthesis